jgi:hypothetical protein
MIIFPLIFFISVGLIFIGLLVYVNMKSKRNKKRGRPVE